jgi:hypothetical protein
VQSKILHCCGVIIIVIIVVIIIDNNIQQNVMFPFLRIVDVVHNIVPLFDGSLCDWSDIGPIQKDNPSTTTTSTAPPVHSNNDSKNIHNNTIIYGI